MAKECPWGACTFNVAIEARDPFTIIPNGRTRWALECLIAAGPKGCAPIDTPGPRWSSYVHKLRAMGVPIETVTEPHDGPFAGTHARYVLRATVTHFRLSEVVE